MASRDDDFLARWSRRKVQKGQGLRKKESAPPHEPGDELPPEAVEEQAEAGTKKPAQVTVAAEPGLTFAEELRAEEAEPTVAVNQTPPARSDDDEDAAAGPGEFDDVDFDALNFGSDYKRFMEKGVPDIVRRRALRALWSSNPILANIDGLNDYDEDFTDAALAIKIVGSNYKPGKGYLTDEEREASYGDSDEQAPQENQVETSEDDDDLDDGEDLGVEIADADDEASAQKHVETDASPESNEET